MDRELTNQELTEFTILINEGMHNSLKAITKLTLKISALENRINALEKGK